MERSRGTEGIKLVECINPRLQKYIVRWDIQPYVEEQEEREQETNGVSFVQHTFLHKPSFSEIKDVITEWMNSEIDAKIASGFTWNGMQVWLSTENQFNYKTAFDLAVQTEGTSLPITFKFGTTAEPVYHTFSEFNELKEFYSQAVMFVQNTLAEGWTWKDGFDFSPYEEVNW